MSHNISSQGAPREPIDLDKIKKFDKMFEGLKGFSDSKADAILKGVAKFFGLTFSYEGKTIFLSRENSRKIREVLEIPTGSFVGPSLKNFVRDQVQSAIRQENIVMTKPLFEKALSKLGVRDPEELKMLEGNLQGKLHVEGDTVTISRDDLLEALKPHENEIHTTDSRYRSFADQMKNDVHGFHRIGRPYQEKQPSTSSTSEKKLPPAKEPPKEGRAEELKLPEITQGEIGEANRVLPQATRKNFVREIQVPEVREGEIGQAERILPEKPAIKEAPPLTLAQKLRQKEDNLTAARAAFKEITQKIPGMKSTIDQIAESEIGSGREAKEAIDQIDKQLADLKQAVENYRSIAQGGQDKRAFDADYKEIGAAYEDLINSAEKHKASLTEAWPAVAWIGDEPKSKEPTMAEILTQIKKDTAEARSSFLTAGKEIGTLKKTIEQIGKKADSATEAEAKKGVQEIDRRLQGILKAFETYRSLAKGGADLTNFQDDVKKSDFDKLMRTANFQKDQLRKVYVRPATIQETVIAPESYEEVSITTPSQDSETVEEETPRRAYLVKGQVPKAPASDMPDVAQKLAEDALQAVRARADRVAEKSQAQAPAETTRPAHIEEKIQKFNSLRAAFNDALTQAEGRKELKEMLMELKGNFEKAEKFMQTGELTYDDFIEVLYLTVSDFIDTPSGMQIEQEITLGATPKKLGDVAYFLQQVADFRAQDVNDLSDERITELENAFKGIGKDYKKMPSDVSGMTAQRQDELERAEIAAKKRTDAAVIRYEGAREAHFAAKKEMAERYEKAVDILKNDPEFIRSLTSRWGTIGRFLPGLDPGQRLFVDKYTSFEELMDADVYTMRGGELFAHLEALHNLVVQGKIPESALSPVKEFTTALDKFETARSELLAARDELRAAKDERAKAKDALWKHVEAWTQYTGPEREMPEVGKLQPGFERKFGNVAEAERQKMLSKLSQADIREMGKTETRAAVREYFTALIRGLEADPAFSQRLSSGKGVFRNDEFFKKWNAIKGEIAKMEDENFGPDYLTYLFIGMEPEYESQGFPGNLADQLQQFYEGQQPPSWLPQRFDTLAALLSHLKEVNSEGKE